MPLWISKELRTQQLLMRFMPTKATFVYLLSGYHLFQHQALNHSGSDFEAQYSSGHSKFFVIRSMLKQVFKVKIWAVSSNLCCGATQRVKMLSKEEIFIVYSNWRYTVGIPNCTVSAPGVTDLGMEESIEMWQGDNY